MDRLFNKETARLAYNSSCIVIDDVAFSAGYGDCKVSSIG